MGCVVRVGEGCGCAIVPGGVVVLVTAAAVVSDCNGVTGCGNVSFRYSLDDSKCPKVRMSGYLASTGCWIVELTGCVSFGCINSASIWGVMVLPEG